MRCWQLHVRVINRRQTRRQPEGQADRAGKEVGRIDKKFVGVLKAVFTPADKHIVDIDSSLSGDLRLLAIAASTAVDTALKQDARGFSVTDLIPD